MGTTTQQTVAWLVIVLPEVSSGLTIDETAKNCSC
jgi:hypothetical protein